jgi:hypothetical protein
MPPFGRRATAWSPRQEPHAAPVRGEPPRPAALIDIDRTADEAVARDIEQWNALRKAKKRSFREPWRSVAIAASAMFGLSLWLLPDSVATIAEIVTSGLTIMSIAAGMRKR